MRLLLDLQACQSSSMNRGIGRYSIALALAIARNSASHELRIVLNSAFPDGAAALRKAFDGLVPSSAIISFSTPMPAAGLDPANGWRVQAAERIREHYLASQRPDVVHVASLFEGLTDDSVTSLLHGEGRFDTAITLYDLIPLLRKEQYLGDPNIAAWYYRKLQSLKNAELLLAISGHAREEAIGALQLAPNSVVNISSAVDDIFRPRVLAPDARASLMARHGLRRPFIMYTGGIDYRKNIEGLIEAFALLPGEMRRQYQLSVVCSIHDADRVRLQRLASTLQLAEDDLVLTGFVTDDDLVSLYNCTSLFVFPSLHEGFGLPALEAMACGAPVIGSDASSIPEVIGRGDALFDPTSTTAIAMAMARVLGDPHHANALRAHGLAQARLFSWDASAKRAVAAFEETHQRNCAARTAVAVAAYLPRQRPRMAYVSPLPPARSGIADYSADLLPELAKYYDIELVLAQPILDNPWALHNFPQRSVAWFDAHAHEYDRIVYQFGNSSFHSHMFDLLERHPGVVVLHDFFLSGIVNHVEDDSRLPNQYCRSLYLSHGYGALANEQVAGRAVSSSTYPCNRAVLERATGIIVHSAHAVELAIHWYGPDIARDWRVLPLLRKLPDIIDKAAARRELGIGGDDFLLCSFGMVAPTKCNDAIVQAWIDSSAAHNPACHLVFVGEAGKDDFSDALRARIADYPRIRITGYVSETLYNNYLGAADGAIQLRSGSRGETSAAVLDCLAHRLPTIVNAHGSAAELPSHTCMLLEDKFNHASLCTAIDLLQSDAALRLRLASAAAAYMQAHSPARVGVLVRDAIDACTRDACGAAEQRLIGSIAGILGDGSNSDHLQAAASIAANRPARGLRQLLVDVTHLAQSGVADTDATAQCNMVSAMVVSAPTGWRIEPVRFDGRNFRYARRFTLDLIKRADVLIEDAVADADAGDILLCIDHDQATALPLAWQTRGVTLQASPPHSDIPQKCAALAGLVVSRSSAV